MKVSPGKHNEVADAIQKLQGVKIVFPTMGRQDVVAGVEVAGLRELALLVSQFQAHSHVKGTETLMGLEV